QDAVWGCFNCQLQQPAAGLDIGQIHVPPQAARYFTFFTLVSRTSSPEYSSITNTPCFTVTFAAGDIVPDPVPLSATMRSTMPKSKPSFGFASGRPAPTNISGWVVTIVSSRPRSDGRSSVRLVGAGFP